MGGYKDPCDLGLYSQNFLKYVLTKVIKIVRHEFFLKFSEKCFVNAKFQKSYEKNLFF
jgi:hypothetical protein